MKQLNLKYHLHIFIFFLFILHIANGLFFLFLLLIFISRMYLPRHVWRKRCFSLEIIIINRIIGLMLPDDAVPKHVQCTTYIFNRTLYMLLYIANIVRLFNFSFNVINVVLCFAVFAMHSRYFSFYYQLI